MKFKYKDLLSVLSVFIIGLAAILSCGGCVTTDDELGRELAWKVPLTIVACYAIPAGTIVGNQSGEPGEGAAVGAAITTGILLTMNWQDKKQESKQIDNQENTQIKEIYVIQIRNSDGSVVPIAMRKSADIYVGPNNEIYNQLPREEQLRRSYGF